jgi:hypothetical protein
MTQICAMGIPYALALRTPASGDLRSQPLTPATTAPDASAGPVLSRGEARAAGCQWLCSVLWSHWSGWLKTAARTKTRAMTSEGGPRAPDYQFV